MSSDNNKKPDVNSHEPALYAVAAIVPTGVRFPRWLRTITGDKNMVRPYRKIRIMHKDNPNRYVLVGYTTRPRDKSIDAWRVDTETKLLLKSATDIKILAEDEGVLGLIGAQNFDLLGNVGAHQALADLSQYMATIADRVANH